MSDWPSGFSIEGDGASILDELANEGLLDEAPAAEPSEPKFFCDYCGSRLRTGNHDPVRVRIPGTSKYKQAYLCSPHREKIEKIRTVRGQYAQLMAGIAKREALE